MLGKYFFIQLLLICPLILPVLEIRHLQMEDEVDEFSVSQANISPRDIPSDFKPNEEAVRGLCSMLKIHSSWVVYALFVLGNNASSDKLCAWIFEKHPRFVEIDDEPDDNEEPFVENIEWKMVFVVNAGLPMGTGKTAAQVGHAAVSLYAELLSGQGEAAAAAVDWMQCGAKKVVLKCSSTEELLRLKNFAMTNDNLEHYLVSDAGLTQVDAGSFTVLSIFGRALHVDELTGELALL